MSPFRNRLARIAISLAVLCLALAACQRQSVAPHTDNAPTALPPQVDSALNLTDDNGIVQYDGTVGDAKSRDDIERALAAAYGAARKRGQLQVSPGAMQPAWIRGLDIFLPALATVPGAGLKLGGQQATLTGAIEPSQRRALRDVAQRAFPGMRLTGLFDLLPPVDGTAGRISRAALSSTLRSTTIDYKPGSGEVSDDSLALVSRAADALRAAPEGTRLLIVGPVAPSSDAGNDMFLSRQRAEALKVQLILQGVSPAAIETRGWGQNPDGSPIPNALPPPAGAAMHFELLH